MAGGKTHYDALGVSREASSVDVAAAYRERIEALKASGALQSEEATRVRLAYQVLASPLARAEYDEALRPPAPIARVRRPPPAPRQWPRWLPAATVIVVVAITIWALRPRPRVPVPALAIDRKQVTVLHEPPVREPPPLATVANPAMIPSAPRSAEEVFAAASPSIVRVLALDASARPIAQGSGVVVEPGRAVTNCHVVAGSARVLVKTGAEILSASIAVADEELDLCSLAVSGLAAPAVTIASAARLRVGQHVYAIGAPQGLELTLSEGLVSSLRETSYGALIQTTAPVSPGSSGGGLFDTEGQLVGIVTFQLRQGQNLNFAVPGEWIGSMQNRSAPQ